MNRKLELPQTKTDEKPIKRKRDEHSIRRHEKTNDNYIKLKSGDTFELHIDFVISTSKPKTIDQTDLEQYMQMKFYEYMKSQ